MALTHPLGMALTHPLGWLEVLFGSSGGSKAITLRRLGGLGLLIGSSGGNKAIAFRFLGRGGIGFSVGSIILGFRLG